MMKVNLSHTLHLSWLDGSVVERRSLTGELSLVCTGPAADYRWVTIYIRGGKDGFEGFGFLWFF